MQKPELELAPDDGGQRHQLALSLVEPVESAADEVMDALRHGHAGEEHLTACGGGGIEAPGRRRGSWDCELVEVKGRELAGDQIRGVTDVAEPSGSRDGKLRGIVLSRVEEGTSAVHL